MRLSISMLGDLGPVFWPGGGWGADKTGKGRSGWRESSYEVTPSWPMGPGTADGSLAGQHGCGSRFAGQAAPGKVRQPAAARRWG